MVFGLCSLVCTKCQMTQSACLGELNGDYFYSYYLGLPLTLFLKLAHIVSVYRLFVYPPSPKCTKCLLTQSFCLEELDGEYFYFYYLRFPRTADSRLLFDLSKAT